MSEQESKRPVLKHHAFGIPNPKLPPRNTSASVQGDQRCSSPGCLDYASSTCNFCRLHCMRFHKGIHYRRKSSLEIEKILDKYKSDKRLR